MQGVWVRDPQKPGGQPRCLPPSPIPTWWPSPRPRKLPATALCVMCLGILLTFWRPVSYSWTPAKKLGTMWEQRQKHSCPTGRPFFILSPNLSHPQRGRQTQCLLAAGKSLTHFLQLQTRGQSPFTLLTWRGASSHPCKGCF